MRIPNLRYRNLFSWFDVEYLGKKYSEKELKENPNWIVSDCDVFMFTCSQCKEKIKFFDYMGGSEDNTTLESHVKIHEIENTRIGNIRFKAYVKED